jgi:multisubunit Na+/H+ antiporter MnhE subunit
MSRPIWAFTRGLLLGGGFYMLLIDTPVPAELYVLAGVAVACAIAFFVSREQGFTEARVHPKYLLSIWRLAIKIPLDIGLVCWAALAQLVRPRAGPRGEFRAVRFDATAESPQHAGRRATAEVLGSVTPNTIVVGVDAERGLLLVHQLHRQGPPEDLDVLRLG